MSQRLLEIKNLTVNVDEKEILHGLDLTVNKGEVHVIMGPNGAGKSTLGMSLMGHPAYNITSGEVNFDGEDLLSLDISKRSLAGLFISFQNPLEVKGISLSSFIRSSIEAHGKNIKLWEFKKELKKKMKVLQMDDSYADRDLNVGFSGGERKKSEILQLLMIDPKLAILDETDSGLDVDAVRTVSEGVAEFMKNGESSLIIITHSTKLLESLNVDFTHILVDGRIVKNGDGSLVDEINKTGFAEYEGQ